MKVADFNPNSGTVAVSTRKGKGVVKTNHVVLTAEGAQFFKNHTAGKQGKDLVFKHANGEPWKSSHQKRPMEEASQRARD